MRESRIEASVGWRLMSAAVIVAIEPMSVPNTPARSGTQSPLGICAPRFTSRNNGLRTQRSAELRADGRRADVDLAICSNDRLTGAHARFDLLCHRTDVGDGAGEGRHAGFQRTDCLLRRGRI